MADGISKVPLTNLRGLKDHWRQDLLAGFSVALVALPLALGIAGAAGAPPISGLVSAIIAGLLTTFMRGSHVAINGPGNSLIVIIASGFAAFGGGPDVFPHVLGAAIVAGGIQMLLGVLRLGKIGDVIPAAVVQGMLAAIGLIIVAKQMHVLFGVTSKAATPIAAFQELPNSIGALHAPAALIGVLSLVMVAIHPKIKAKWIHVIPAPLWVVIVTVPMAVCASYFDPQITGLVGRSLKLAPEMLVSIPDNLIGSLTSPQFSRIGESAFWGVVLTLCLVTTIENIVSVKAVDKLDTFRRASKMDRDLIAAGFSTIVSGVVGGLPILTVVARSSVNVNHGARTGWSNFFHGLVLLIFVLFLGPIIEELALSALAGILVYTGFKLTAPNVIKDTLRKGPDHFIIFAVTVLATLEYGLLKGISIGIFAELTSHGLMLGMRPIEAFRALRQTKVETVEDASGARILRVTGLANFVAIPKLRRALGNAVAGKRLIVDFSGAMLVDNTLLEYVHAFARRHAREPGCSCDLIGLEAHRAIADHPDSLHAKERRLIDRRLTRRQSGIAEIAKKRGWTFDARRDWDPDHLDDFHFFRVHPIEYRDTVVHGVCELEGEDAELTLSDVTFDEGALIPEVYHTTALAIQLPVAVPELVIDEERLFDRVISAGGLADIDFEESKEFSRRFLLLGADENAVRAFMTPDLMHFLEEHDIYHVESTGRQVVIFKTFMRRATVPEIEKMLEFGDGLVKRLVEAHQSLPDKYRESVDERAEVRALTTSNPRLRRLNTNAE